MQLLKELLEIGDTYYKVNGFDIIEEKMNELKSIMDSIIKEGFVDDHRGDLEREFDDLEKKYIAARRALGTINRGAKRLSPEEAKMHRSKIMRFINIFRSKLQDVMLDLNMSNKEIEYHLNRMDNDRRNGRPNEVFSRDKLPNRHSRQDVQQPPRRNVA